MDDCIFCKIIKGDIPSTKVYEDDDFLAFLDIMPANKGHVLVIPKEHHEQLTDLPDELASKLILKVKDVAKTVVSGLELEGFNIVQNNGKVSGQVVPHVHFHIIPRKSEDGLNLEWRHLKYEDGEAEEYQNKIKG